MPARLNQKRAILIIFSIVTVILLSLVTFFVLSNQKDRGTISVTDTSKQTRQSAKTSESTSSEVTWQWTGESWSSSATAPACTTPLLTELPIDINKVTTILYPGQTRSGQYKPHGGFRFGTDNSIVVTVPLDASVTEGSRYIEGGEVQSMFTLVNSCGIAYRFDHLHTLSEKFQKLADQLPEAKVDDSRTTSFDPPIKVVKGDIVATKVGFVKTQNVSVDFGVYDLRNTNEAAKNTTFVQSHDNEKQFAFYGICWLKEYPSEISQKLLVLPGGDSVSGKTSDYCK